MKKSEEISSFFYSQYFGEGLRITMGAIIPVIVCALIGEFTTGTLISLGALVVGISDTPGAPAHRRAGVVYCTMLCVLTIMVTVLLNGSLIAMTLAIAAFSFIYSMFAVFNTRASTIGTMCLLIMLINVDDVYTLQEELTYLAYFIIGALWYMVISFSITYVRPYRLAQQELSETILQVADYIRLKANFYDIKHDVDVNYDKLIEKQIEVNAHQENVRDILFQSKRSIKDTTKQGRFLTLIFSDIVDLFEQSMATHYDYAAIREKYASSGLLEKIKLILRKVSYELDNISYRLHAEKLPLQRHDLNKEIDELRAALEEYDKKQDTNSIALKKIIVNIRTIVNLILQIYSYCQLKKIDIEKEEITQSQKFVKTDIINWQRFRDNLNLNSTIFRHALRMSITLSLTYLILNLIHFSEFGIYWILLTILVILKPGFGMTKERNLQRIIGTIIGGVLGAVILMLIPDMTTRFIILIFFFLIAYSLFRVNYIIAVIFMTPYVLILLSFTGVNTLEIAKERVIDTLLGGTIAFVCSYVIFPNWESLQIKKNMRGLLIANYQYLAQAINILSGQKIAVTDYKLARKEVYIASANMASTFQRLLTEPKWRQKTTKEVNRFVILNHILSSYSTTLMTQLKDADTTNFNNEDVRLFYRALQNLEKAIYTLDDQENNKFTLVKSIKNIEDCNPNNDDAIIITEQLQFLVKISADLLKVTTELISKNQEE